jgi:hypothetical protein
MLLYATFIAICSAAALFLLRFLVAINAEEKPVPGRVERITSHQTRPRVRKSTSGLILIYSNPARQVVDAPTGIERSFASRETKSRLARM